MARYVTTKSATGAATGGGGGASGPTAAEVCQYACKAVCDLFCTNFITPACRPTLNYMPVPDRDWNVICHCNCWTNCFGCTFRIDLDTTKYKAFRICFAGQKIRACCYYYMCAAIMQKTAAAPCWCCCAASYRYLRVCNREPVPRCCCCSYFGQCRCGYSIGYNEGWCWCCRSGCDGNAFWDFKLCAAPMRPVSNNMGSPWMYDLCWVGQKQDEWYSDFLGQCMRIYGVGGCAMTAAWSPCQNFQDYINGICFMANLPIESTLSSGNYCQHQANPCNQPYPLPNWTIWGQPCCFPVNVGLWSGTTAPTANDPYE